MDLRGGLVVEKDERVYRALISARAAGPAATRRILANVELRLGDINDEIGKLPEQDINLVNLDYVGQMSSGKERALEELLESPRLAERTVIVVTLDDSELAAVRSNHRGYAGDPVELIERKILNSGWRVWARDDVRYLGGTNGRNSRPMRASLFCLGDSYPVSA
jgi:hypothetical protein